MTVSQRPPRVARRSEVQRVVVDVRLNHGGDNTTYGALLDATDRLSRTRSVMLLIGRDLPGRGGTSPPTSTRCPVCGCWASPPSGAPSQWGDSSAVELLGAGLTARVATSYQRFAAQARLRPGRTSPSSSRSRTSSRDATRCSRVRSRRRGRADPWHRVAGAEVTRPRQLRSRGLTRRARLQQLRQAARQGGDAGAIDAALEAGITFLDTADTYGSGESERFIGAALGDSRDRVVLASKFGQNASVPGSAAFATTFGGRSTARSSGSAWT